MAQKESAESAAAGFQLSFKFVLVGESGVGKTAICKRFCEHTFEERGTPTVGLEFGSRIVQVEGTPIKLQIWDTAGQERFHSITRSYFRASVAVFLVYDVTKRDSFSELGVWVENAVQLAPPHAVKVLIGNKTDLVAERTVSTAEAQDFADQNSLRFFETSARSGDRLEDAFLQAAHDVYAKTQIGKVEFDRTSGARVPIPHPSPPPPAQTGAGGGCC